MVSFNSVSLYVLIGAGEDADELVAGAGRLIERGVYPFVVPLRPMLGTLARTDGVTAPAERGASAPELRLQRRAERGKAAAEYAPSNNCAYSA